MVNKEPLIQPLSIINCLYLSYFLNLPSLTPNMPTETLIRTYSAVSSHRIDMMRYIAVTIFQKFTTDRE